MMLFLEYFASVALVVAGGCGDGAADVVSLIG